MTQTQGIDSRTSGADVVGATIAESDTAVSHTNTIADLEHLVSEIGWNRRRADVLAEDSTQLQADYQRLHGESLRQLLRVRTAEQSKREVQSLLAELGDNGFAWSDIARIIGVSVPALRKWRHGESPSGENRRRVAELVAVCHLIAERNPIVTDIAGWLETALSPESPASGIDLLASHRYDLLLEYADGADPEAILDAFDASWRDGASDEVEVFTAADGMPALRLRPSGG
jgi:hypothetical protein